MIKVIQKKDEHRKRVNCLTCGAILEYGYSDRHINSYYDPGLKLDIYEAYITCPECSHMVMIDKWAREGL